MTADDMVSIRGQVMEYMYIPTGIKRELVRSDESCGRVRQNILILLSCVFLYLSTVISSIFGKSFHFPFPYFVLFVLWYFPLHVFN